MLVIGIDGCRPDALAAASTPNLDALIHAGALTDKTQILGDCYRSSDTSSGPGWSSFLTGVWADKHGVNDNTFQGKNYKAFPHFFRLIKDRWPEARTGSFMDWEGVITCMHSDFRIGGLKPGETKTIRGKMYVVPVNEAALLTRYQNDFLK